MKNLLVLATALEVVEDKLKEPLSVEDLAKSCYVSVSGLQKLFNYVFGCSVKEYIAKRKLSLAAYDLIHTDQTITQIALTYTYDSPEVFSKAFILNLGSNTKNINLWKIEEMWMLHSCMSS